jgi:hypothetical protein
MACSVSGEARKAITPLYSTFAVVGLAKKVFSIKLSEIYDILRRKSIIQSNTQVYDDKLHAASKKKEKKKKQPITTDDIRHRI